ncbi:MAG: wax ester/triacylglycerol synthase family O-acyltransferase [Xanthomonadales bacterium]|nr:wax ester/triacylglycerol synthase family O-acyltransferase [Gammaproteobacteria bacterium]NND57200.1 wax ester/triacylglycerol synthase family O-acyltransferase [Xanthomonadales bacterium]NNK50264.1 wax ester/triacylglycerol synthase family O-acyltransferase [Xanthomonadales bacterium]
MHKLSTLDSGFLMTESQHSPKHVGCVQIFRLPGRKRTAWLRRMLEDLKQILPGFPFDQKLRDDSLLSPTLVPDDRFDIEYHVRHTVLPSPGNDDQLVEMVSRLHANLLDRERPLWEFHLIEGLSDRRFAFYTKVHHCIVDGMTFARWFRESGSTDPEDPHSAPIWDRDERPRDLNKGDGAVRFVLDGVQKISNGVKTAASLSALGARLIQQNVFEKNRNAVLPLSAPKTRLNVPTGAARNFSIAKYPLNEFRSLAKDHDASINDLVMTLGDLAVNRYLAEKGEPPVEPLVVYMPVNLREGGNREGNLISLLQVKLASDHEHPLETLRQVRESSRSTREIYQGASTEAIQIYSLAVALLPLGEELLKLNKILPPAINMVISNVPGAPETLYFRGAETIEVYPVNTLPPAVSLSITVCSYAGTLFFGLVGGRTAVPDLKKLTVYLDEAYQEFRSLRLRR